MGAYSPAPVVTPEVHERVMREVVLPTVRGMQADGVPFTGFLYAGLMIDESGAPKVIEFNVRFGDPEAQALMPLLTGSFVQLLQASATEGLSDRTIATSNARTVGVVLAAGGYPGTPDAGRVITGIERAPRFNLQHDHRIGVHVLDDLLERQRLVIHLHRRQPVTADARGWKFGPAHGALQHFGRLHARENNALGAAIEGPRHQ
jgi:hypothetical protein